MVQYIDKDALVAEIDKGINWRNDWQLDEYKKGYHDALIMLKKYLSTIKVKEVDLMMHTIIAECCDWLAINTNLSHDEIEDCRNLMLTVKDEQFKVQKGK